jgi:hypothetical protein
MTRALYLRTGAIDKLMAAVEVPHLNRKQQAALLGMTYNALWRLANAGRKADSRAVADLLAGVDVFCRRYRCKKPNFDELFEIREIEDEPTAAVAA